jgi:phage baseplate assembly protein W
VAASSDNLVIDSTQTLAYSDLDLTLMAHPLTGDLMPKKNIEAVRRSLKTLCSMDYFDIPFDPYSGPSLKALLFEPSSRMTAVAIQTRLEFSIKKYEPRAVLQDLKVEPSADGLGYNIQITFLVKSTSQVDNFTFFVSRVR